jgi:hypothetical protein
MGRQRHADLIENSAGKKIGYVVFTLRKTRNKFLLHMLSIRYSTYMYVCSLLSISLSSLCVCSAYITKFMYFQSCLKVPKKAKQMGPEATFKFFFIHNSK